MRSIRMAGLLTATLIVFHSQGETAMAEELKVGDDAPAFELVGSDGNTYRLADFTGKKAVVVAWYPKAFTGG